MLDLVSNCYCGEIVLISYRILGGWFRHNCILHIYKGHRNVSVSFLYDIVTPSSMIFSSDKMLHFILDLLVINFNIFAFYCSGMLWVVLD